MLGRLGVPYAEGHSATTAAGLIELRSTVDTGQPAPDATRPLFARYLDEVGRSDVAGLIRESGRGWHEMTRLARGGTPALDDLADVMESIMDCERRVAASMAG